MNREDRRKAERGKVMIETGIPGGPVLVGKRLPGVSVGQAGKMLLGQDVPEEVVEKAAQGSEKAHPDMAGHVPTIGALSTVESGWGVFCLRCSSDAGDYVYPCKIDASDWPPQVLVPLVSVDVTGPEVTDP